MVEKKPHPELIAEPDVGALSLPVPAVAANAKGVNVGIMRHPNYDGPGMLTSLPMETDEQRAEAFNVVAGESRALREVEGEVLKICDYILERGTFDWEDSDGPELGVRIWLIDVKGTRYFNASRSVGQCCERVLTWFGLGPWKPPLHLRFTKSLTKKDRPWWNVERLYPTVPVKSKPPAK